MGELVWQVIYADKVLKQDIPNLPTTIAKRIKRAIEEKLTKNPIAFGKPLQYSLKNQRRLRVGDYRILFALDLDKRVVKITSIDHRKDVYS